VTATHNYSLVEVPFEHADSIALRAAQRRELDERYGADTEPGVKPTAADVAVFVVAYDRATDEPVGCGGLRQLDADSAEIKRMFVVGPARGTGVSTLVLRGLEARAAERGWGTLRLETGPEQPDAMRFYEREGYTRIPNFGHYAEAVGSICYERVLERPQGPSIDPAMR
jgi:putative acetyltransferase